MLIEASPSIGIKVIIAKLTNDNEASVNLHTSLGFKTIGVMERVGEKFGRLIDVRIMDLHLDSALG
jgi:phosphinothricin acetyltransferase